MTNALADYDKKNKSKSFTHLDAWKVVKGETKWLKQPCFVQASSKQPSFVQASSTSHSDKRRKSSESAYYESGSNENVQTVLPDLNDNTTPTRKKKEKRPLVRRRRQRIVLLRTSRATRQRKHY